ncbi:hypothetical protein CDL15_Pgr026315 [Punica granatum]|uniref:Uncharacterized protein n=1 Tax=Punica granatum TaxID=22663 RepID=A0A218XXZ8_PUNGR|nr:hypothetical protein CDL15_Pgr026315 [Punica granatum]
MANGQIPVSLLSVIISLRLAMNLGKQRKTEIQALLVNGALDPVIDEITVLVTRVYFRMTETHQWIRKGFADEPAPEQKRETSQYGPPRPVAGVDQFPGSSRVVQEPRKSQRTGRSNRK